MVKARKANPHTLKHELHSMPKNEDFYVSVFHFFLVHSPDTSQRSQLHPHQVYKLSSPNRCLLLPCGILRCLPISAHAHIPPPTIPTVNLFVYFSEETETMLNPPLPARGQKGQWPWMYGTHFSNLHLGQRLACDESYPAYIDLGAASRFSLPLA